MWVAVDGSKGRLSGIRCAWSSPPCTLPPAESRVVALRCRRSRSHRPTFQQDHRPEDKHAEARRRSQQAVCAALAGLGEEGVSSGAAGGGGRDGGAGRGGGSSAAAAAAGSDGSGRSLEAFWEHTGVNFQERVIRERAQQGGLPPESFLSLPEPWDYC